MIKRIDSAAAVLGAVRDEIQARGLSLDAAARAIGVKRQGLVRHLEGTALPTPHAIGKYRLWTENDGRQRDLLGSLRPTALPDLPVTCGEGMDPGAPRRVVDLFAGCGGLSLGFEMFEEGRVFETVLAMDIEQPMVTVFNANSPVGGRGSARVARRVDLEQFSNDAEILAFYLDHLARREDDSQLDRALQHLPSGALSEFLVELEAVDARFHAALRDVRSDEAYVAACRGVLPHTFSQTSVEEFFRRLQIPLVGPRWIGHPVLWQADEVHPQDPERAVALKIGAAFRKRARRQWAVEAERLRARVDQEDSAVKSKARQKITDFLAFLSRDACSLLQEAWVDWQAARTQLRWRFFEEKEAEMLAALRQLYQGDRRVSVILGGPPCQGFSRVGRGKLRSLREEGAHVQADEGAGDERNLLLYKYVQFVSALEPAVFLFENVATFKSHVQTRGGSFDAVDVLERAFDEISDHRIHYEVGMRTIQCADHGLPQFRERFFMAGVRASPGAEASVVGRRLARQCLELPLRESHLPLKFALAGLPEAGQAEQAQRAGALAQSCQVSREGDAAFSLARDYLAWVRRPLDGSAPSRSSTWATDAHVARLPRADDREWFRQMGPGMRWMDYRCDSAPTLGAIKAALGRVLGLLELSEQAARVPAWVRDQLDGLRSDLSEHEVDLRALAKRVDGSLSIRLLLEGLVARHGLAEHHLIRPVYLTKKTGHHGDWLKRLDSEMPCRTVVSHMAKDTYPYVHPTRPRMLSVREAARVQTFPDSFSFGKVGVFHAFRMIGNAVPPMLSNMLAERVSIAVGIASRADGAAVSKS